MSTLFGIEEGILCQQVNCQNAMGAGLAKAIYEQYPKVKENYHYLFTKYSAEDLYGKKVVIPVSDTLSVANLYTQFDYKKPEHEDGRQYTNVEYLVSAIKDLTEKYPHQKIYIPYNIGCGLAGGNWQEVFPKIKEIGSLNLYLIDTLNQRNMPFLIADANTFAPEKPKETVKKEEIKVEEPVKEEPKVEKDIKSAENDNLKRDFAKKSQKEPKKEQEMRIFLPEADRKQLKRDCRDFLARDYTDKSIEIHEEEQYISMIAGKTENFYGAQQYNHYKLEYSYKEALDRFTEYEQRRNVHIDSTDLLKQMLNERTCILSVLDILKEGMITYKFDEIKLLDGKYTLKLFKDGVGIQLTTDTGLKLRHTDHIYTSGNTYYVERSNVSDLPQILSEGGYVNSNQLMDDLLMDLMEKDKEINQIKGIENEEKPDEEIDR